MLESAIFSGGFRMLNHNIFLFDRPDLAIYDIDLVAHMLAKKCRFGDHIQKHYSIAEHSCHAHDLYARNPKGALMHDSPEFVTGDLVSPIKRNVDGFDAIENRIMRDMETRFNFKEPDKLTFKLVDTLLFHIEETFLYDDAEKIYDIPVHIQCWTPEEAKEEFLKRFHSH